MVSDALAVSIATIIAPIISGTLIEMLRRLRNIDKKLEQVDINCKRLNHMSSDVEEIKIRITAIENATTCNRS